MTPRTVAPWAPLSMGLSRQQYWCGLLCPPPGDLLNPQLEPVSLTSPALAEKFFTGSAAWEAPWFSLKALYLIYVADSLASNSRPKAFFFKNLVKLIYLVTSGLSCGSRDLVSCGMFPCGAWAFSSCVSRVQLRQGDSLVVHRLQSLQA